MAPRSFSPLFVCLLVAGGVIRSIHGIKEIKAVSYDMMGTPPNLTGPLEQNFLLTKAERYKVDQIRGPESFVYDNGHIYTGLSDGRIVDISDCGVRTIINLAPPGCKSACGRPLGLRMAPGRKLIVADTVLGILSVDIDTGSAIRLFSTDTLINNRKCKFINDLVVARDGTILFTDSSAKWSRNEYLYIVLEGESSGRLIALSPQSKKAIVVLDKLSFPNGLEFGPNEEYLLIAEASRARIRKLDLRKGSQTWLRQSWFAINLPGLPDNIRASGRGTFWIAMSASRNDYMNTSRVDQLADKPDMRNMVAMIAEMNQIEDLSEQYGTIIEMDVAGNIIRSLQDPTGERVPRTSEVLERDGFLYLGSFDKPYVSRVPLTQKFDVDRFIAKIKSTCRAVKINLVNLKKVLRRIVAFAELRRTLLAAKKRREEMERAMSTTTSAPLTVNVTDTSTANITDVSSSMDNSTVSMTSSNDTTTQLPPTTTMSEDSGPVTPGSTTPSDPEAGDLDTGSSSSSTVPATSAGTPVTSGSTVSSGDVSTSTVTSSSATAQSGTTVSLVSTADPQSASTSQSATSPASTPVQTPP